MTGFERQLRRRLADAPVPGAGASGQRSWRVVSAAWAEREPVARRARPRRTMLAAVVAAACAVAVAIALTPPGEAVGDWIRDVVRSKPAPPHSTRPALGPLPAQGRLLVVGRTGPWIVQRDGSRRRLGAYDDAAFSPRGLFVAVTRGLILAAVDPRGGVRWTLTLSARVTRPAWSPDGFRVAYRSGDQLRVVYGDGALDRGLARRSAAVAPAWRPGVARHLLAWVDARGRVVLGDADTGTIAWRVAPVGRVRQLAWSPSGRRLLAVTAGAVHVLRADGRTRRVLWAPAEVRVRRAAWLPDGSRFGVLRAAPGRPGGAATTSEVVVQRLDRPSRARRLLAVPGRLTGLLAAPDGRWLLAGAPDADQWLLVRTAGPGHLTALSNVARQFDPGALRRGTPPRLVGWIR